MSSHVLAPGLQLFYDLVHRLNSTLDLDIVLAQVIEQVNRFLDIDATSVSLLDADSQELIIQMTIGSATDPHPGLRLPPHAGISGWVAHRGEPVLIDDAQRDNRFYPAVDQLTGFNTRAVICVPLLVKDRTIGVIQAMSRSPGMFSRADLYFVLTVADVAALAIENARLYNAEREARRQAEALKRVAEAIASPRGLEEVLSLALEQLQQVVPYESAAILVADEYAPSGTGIPQGGDTPGGTGEERCFAVLSARGFDDRCSVHDTCVPEADVPLFQRLRLIRRPIAIVDTQADGRYVCWSGTEPARSWMGVPMIVQREVVGHISIDRFQVSEFTAQEVEVATAFAQQIAAAITNCRLRRQSYAGLST